MSYAQVAHVKARAGRLAPSWHRDSTPGDTDIEVFLEDETDKVNSAITARGLDVPADDTIVAGALRGVVADGALLLALSGTFPADEGPAAARKLIEVVQARYDAAWSALNDGTHVAILVLEGSDTDKPSASDFWSEEPDYGLLDFEERETLNPYLQPEAERGMVY